MSTTDTTNDDDESTDELLADTGELTEVEPSGPIERPDIVAEVVSVEPKPELGEWFELGDVVGELADVNGRLATLEPDTDDGEAMVIPYSCLGREAASVPKPK